jgi:hypothetical protein
MHAFANKDIILLDNKSSKIPMWLKTLQVRIPATLDIFIQLTAHLMGQGKQDQSNNLVIMINNLSQLILEPAKEIF